MVVRDRDVLLDMTRGAGCTVYMSVPTVDEDAWRTLEPGTAHPLQRLRAVRELRRRRHQRRRADGADRPRLLLVSRAKLEAHRSRRSPTTARAFVGCNVMYLKDGTRDHFMEFSRANSPRWSPRFERLYARKYAPTGYRKRGAGDGARAAAALRRERAETERRSDGPARRTGTARAADGVRTQVGFRW